MNSLDVKDTQVEHNSQSKDCQDMNEILPAIHESQVPSVDLENKLDVINKQLEFKKKTKNLFLSLTDNLDLDDKTSTSQENNENISDEIPVKECVNFEQSDQHVLQKCSEAPEHIGGIEVDHNGSIKYGTAIIPKKSQVSGPRVCRPNPMANLEMPAAFEDNDESPLHNPQSPPGPQDLGVVNMDTNQVDSPQPDDHDHSNQNSSEFLKPEGKGSEKAPARSMASPNWKHLKEAYNSRKEAQTPKCQPTDAKLTEQCLLPTGIITLRQASTVFKANLTLEREEEGVGHNVVGKNGIMTKINRQYESEEISAPLNRQTNLQAQSGIQDNSNPNVLKKHADTATRTGQADNRPPVVQNETNFDAAAKFSQAISAYTVKRGWKTYVDYVTNSETTIFSHFKMGFTVCALGIIGLVACVTGGLLSAPATCKRMLTIGTILGGAITAVGGIWMMVAEPSNITKAKLGAVVAGLIGIGGLVTTTMDQIKDWCPDNTGIIEDLVPTGLERLGYNPVTDKSNLHDEFLPYAFGGAVAERYGKNGPVMVAGGFNRKDGVLNKAFFFDDVNHTSRAVRPMSHSRNSAAGGWIGDTFVMCGGMKEPNFSRRYYSPGFFLATCEGFNITTGMWSPLASAPFAVGTAGYVINGTKLYMFGGFDGNATGDAAVYSFESNSWEVLPSLPGRRNFPAAVVDGDVILICGGYVYVSLKDCFKFDPATLQYQKMAPMMTARYSFALVKLNDVVVAIGGKAVEVLKNKFGKKKKNIEVTSVEMLDVGGSWREIGRLENGISYFNAVVQLKKSN